MARVAGVEIWVADVTEIGPDVRRLLSDDERDRADSFLVPGARALFVASRVLQRRLGARYLGVPPESVVVERRCRLCGDEQHGRPYLPGGPDYSVSHSATLVVLGYAEGRRVGVDVEADDRKIDVELLAGHVLSPVERESLAALDDAPARRRFLALWARKEATVKLTGHGLLVPLPQVSVEHSTVQIGQMPDGWPDEPIGLLDLDLGAGYVGALAYTGPRPEVTTRRVDELLR